MFNKSITYSGRTFITLNSPTVTLPLKHVLQSHFYLSVPTAATTTEAVLASPDKDNEHFPSLLKYKIAFQLTQTEHVPDREMYKLGGKTKPKREGCLCLESHTDPHPAHPKPKHVRRVYTRKDS